MIKKNIIFHPWLLALIPIINLYEHNQDIASAYYLTKPIIITLVGTTSLFFILNILIKNRLKSAFISSAIVSSFFLFNTLAGLFISVNNVISYELIPYEALAIIVYIIVILAIACLIATSHRNLNKINKILNFFASIIVILQLFSLANYQYQNSSNIIEALEFNSEQAMVTNIDPHENINLPDIYYIILDGYARADTLANIYNYDNSPFIDFLKEKGFYVAEESHTNYNQTFLSISSSLNLNYLDKLAAAVGYETNDRAPLKKALRNNFVYDFLKARNYTFVDLPPTWSGTYKNIKADIHLNTTLEQNSFDSLLIQKTPLAIFLPNLQINSLARHTNNTLAQIPAIAKIKQPTFSYIHILSPHPPFIFEADGSIVSRLMYCMEAMDGSHYFASCPGIARYQKHYVAQLAYLNKRFESIINEILANSTTPPIIILQGDHGPGSMLDWESLANSNIQERFSILNAYYVPEATKAILYPSISPVNSFRVIFNSVFKSQFEILEDKSYFATWSKPYYFMDVSEQLK